MSMHRFISLAAITLGLSVGSVAHAQYNNSASGPGYSPPAYKPPQVRKGLTLGASIGLGELSCEDESSTGTGPCDGITEAGSLDGHIGIMLSPRLAIMGDVWIMAHTDDDLTISQTIFTAAAQLWLTPRLWIKGGLGFAHAQLDFDAGFIELQSRSDNVPAGMLAVGYELMHKPNFALDLALKGGTGIYEDDQTRAHNVAVTLGANWY